MKSYRQFCGVAKALDCVGERWTLLIVRDLLLGPRRYSDLQRGLPGITTNLLALRLKQMREAGLVDHRQLPAPAAVGIYELTEMGRELESAILALGKFGAQFMQEPSPQDRLDSRWAMLSLKRRYTGSLLNAKIEVRLDERDYALWIDTEHLRVIDGVHEEPDARVSGDFRAWFELLAGRSSLRQLLDSGRIQRSGSLRSLQQFIKAVGGVP